MRIGVMAVQGSFSLHCKTLAEIGVEPVEVRRATDMADLSGIIIPGGESTTFQLMLQRTDLGERLFEELRHGLPCWGTCAGAILLGRSEGKIIHGYGLIDVDVIRNAYGRQVDSFVASLNIKGFCEPFNGVFIRAPRLLNCGKRVEVLAEYSHDPVMIRQWKLLITTFHPELTSDTRIHRYFVEEICQELSGGHLEIAS